MRRVEPGDPDFESARQRQLAWQTGRIEEDEAQLTRDKVPRKYWIYVAVNSDPTLDTENERQGTWSPDRVYIMSVVSSQNTGDVWPYVNTAMDSMYFAVVDGRVPDRIKAMITQSWQEYDMAKHVAAWRTQVDSPSVN